MARVVEKAIDWVGGHEVIVFLGLFPLVAGLWAFIEVADKVREGRTQHVDERMILALRRPEDPATPVGPAWLAEAARDVTALGSATVLVLVTASVVGFLLFDRKFAAAAYVVAAAGSGLVVSSALKALFRRPRPDIVPHLMRAAYSSFPSGHSVMSAVVYLTLGGLLTRLVAARRLKAYVLAVAVTLTALVGVSRVYMGVHYPSDVLGGWCVGLAWASACWLVALRLQRSGVIERES